MQPTTRKRLHERHKELFLQEAQLLPYLSATDLETACRLRPPLPPLWVSHQERGGYQARGMRGLLGCGQALDQGQELIYFKGFGDKSSNGSALQQSLQALLEMLEAREDAFSPLSNLKESAPTSDNLLRFYYVSGREPRWCGLASQEDSQPGGLGGTMHFEDTMNNGRGSTPASIAVAAGQATATYRFKWSGALPADHTYLENGGVIVDSSNQISSPPVGSAGRCSEAHCALADRLPHRSSRFAACPEQTHAQHARLLCPKRSA